MGTSGEEKECPLIEEISIINKWSRDCIILIDDANYFLANLSKNNLLEFSAKDLAAKFW